jgi:hypothetical protein
MNERIKELVKQAGLNIDGYDYPIWGCLDGEDEKKEFLEKFAELIVKECDHLIQQQVSLKFKDGWEQSGVSDDWAYGYYAASTLSRTILKQHFGVK